MPCNFSPGWGLMTAPQKQPGIAATISAAAISAFLVGWTVAAAADFEESVLRRCATGNLFGPIGPLPGHWRSGAKAAQIRVLRRKPAIIFFLFPADRPFLSGLRQPPPPNLKSAPYIRAPTLFWGKVVSGHGSRRGKGFNSRPNRCPVVPAGKSRRRQLFPNRYEGRRRKLWSAV